MQHGILKYLGTLLIDQSSSIIHGKWQVLAVPQIVRIRETMDVNLKGSAKKVSNVHIIAH